MRLVICGGIQYDADNLPAHVDASKCVPADKWFADNRSTRKAAPAAAEPVEKVDEAPRSKRRGRSRKG